MQTNGVVFAEVGVLTPLEAIDGIVTEPLLASGFHHDH